MHSEYLFTVMEENRNLRKQVRELTGEDESPLVGDADRDLVIQRVREAFAGGYLTQDELDDRTNEILSSRTQVQLNMTVRGLPAVAVSVAPATRGDQLVAFTARVWYLPYLLLVILAILLIVVS